MVTLSIFSVRIKVKGELEQGSLGCLVTACAVKYDSIVLLGDR